MSKSKGIVLGDHHVRHVKAHQSDGQGLSHYTATGDPQAPPVRTAHRGSDGTTSARYLRGEHSDLNAPFSAKSNMGLDRNAPASKDSPILERGRQMPDKHITSKAQAVADELREHGDGEGPPRGGVRDRD